MYLVAHKTKKKQSDSQTNDSYEPILLSESKTYGTIGLIQFTNKGLF